MECAETGPNGATNWQRDENGSENKYAGVGVATGISLGVVIVAATDDMGVWLAIGIMDSRHPILQTASDLIEIDRPLSPVVSTGRCNTCAEEEGEA